MNLKLIHIAKTVTPSSTGPVPVMVDVRAPHFRWETCLRSLCLYLETHEGDVGSARLLEQGAEVLEGENAYARLLEIICGLHSPLVGETEVFGQFKETVQHFLSRKSNDPAELAFATTLRTWSNALIEDAKLIRQRHLQDLGSQSYGSLVRREIRELHNPHVDFLGGGVLVADILPWVLKIARPMADRPAPVTVHSRDSQRTSTRLAAHSSQVRFANLTDGAKTVDGSSRVLIVAAPMRAEEIVMWMKSSGFTFHLVLDLRGESREDSLAPWIATDDVAGPRIRSLDEAFSSIAAAKGLAVSRREYALQEVELRRLERGSTATHRPFGWDDV